MMNKLFNNKVKLVLLAIIAVAIFIRITAFNGFGGVDDAEHARFAHALSMGEFPVKDYQGPAVFPLRMGIIIPTAVLFKLFGVHEWTMVGFPFIISILGVLVAYLGGRLFFGEIAGIIGAFLWAVLPIDSFHASLLVPDPAGAFFAGSGTLLLVYLFKNPVQKKVNLHILGYLAGLLFGYSWLCKTSLVYLFPFIVILFIFMLQQDFKRNLPIWLAATGGLATILGAEMLFYYFATGDALFRLHSVEQNISGNPAAFDMNTVGNLKAILKRIALTGPLTILSTTQFLLLPLFAIVGGAYAIYWKDKSFLIPILWLLSLICVYNFGSISFKNYIPLLLFDRYLYPLFLPATIITGGFLAKLLSNSNQKDTLEDAQVFRERAFWSVLIATILIVTAINKNYQNTIWFPNWMQAVAAVSKIVTPKERVYTDILSIQGLEFFWDYSREQNTIEFKDVKTEADINPGSYILINKKYLSWLQRKAGWWPNLDGRSHQFVFKDKSPDFWKLIWEGDDARLYKVAEDVKLQ